jgi:hypothetical protein
MLLMQINKIEWTRKKVAKIQNNQMKINNKKLFKTMKLNKFRINKKMNSRFQIRLKYFSLVKYNLNQHKN